MNKTLNTLKNAALYSLGVIALGIITRGCIDLDNRAYRQELVNTRAYVDSCQVVDVEGYNHTIGFSSMYLHEMPGAENLRPDLDFSTDGPVAKVFYEDILELNADHVDSEGNILPGHERLLVKRDLDQSGN